MNTTAFAIVVSLLLFWGTSNAQTTQAGDSQDTEAIAQRYIEAFRKSGVPTPDAVNAALSKARESSTTQNWEIVARLSNSYANVLGAMKDHYSNLYRSSRSGSSGPTRYYIERAADYETQQNNYLSIRNDAYISQAELFLAAGNKANALSLAMTSMRLSGISPNTKAEELIKRIVEYK